MRETPAHLFPTSYRLKHSKHVSYPLGAEALSRALDGVPQHELITCDFGPGSLQNDLDKLDFQVLHVIYRKQLPSFYHTRDAAERGVFEPSWMIRVFAVPVAVRSPIKRLLIEDALPRLVRPWLMEKHHLAGKTGESLLMLGYSRGLAEMVCTVREAMLPDRV
jgi:hypothetical protein